MLFNVLEGETVKIKISVWKECIRSVRGNILRMSRRKSGQESLFSSSKEISILLKKHIFINFQQFNDR